MGAKTTKTRTPNPQPKGSTRRRIPVRLVFHARSMQVAVPIRELIDGGLACLMAARIAAMRLSARLTSSSANSATKSQNVATRKGKERNNGN